MTFAEYVNVDECMPMPILDMINEACTPDLDISNTLGDAGDPLPVVTYIVFLVTFVHHLDSLQYLCVTSLGLIPFASTSAISVLSMQHTWITCT